MRKSVLILMLALIVSMLQACGVKGDPVPPATPAEIGSGRPVSRAPYEGSPATELPSPYLTDPFTDPNEDEEVEE